MDIKIHRFKYRKISVIGVFLIIIGIVGLLNVFQPTKAESPVTFFSGPVNVSLAINNCSSSSDTLDLSVTPNIVTGGFTSDCQNVSVDTNAPDGYDLSVKAVSTNNTNSLLYKNPTTVSPTPNIPATSNTLSSPAIIQPSTWGFAVRSSNVNLSTSPAANFDSVYTAGNANNRFAGMPTTDTAIYSTNQTPSQIDIFEFYYGAKVTANNLAGLYQTTVTYTVVADYTPEPFEGSGWEKSALAGNENIIPTLKEDMIPVILKDDPNKAWFDYSNKRWATMVVIKPEKIQYYDELPVGTEINNLDILGFFTWIPRYAYKITSGLSTGTAGNIDIVFVDINNKNINNSTVYSKTYPTVSGNAMNDYVVHPSFTDGTANGFANGEWDSELPGYWVAKFASSRDDATISDAGTVKKMTSKPNRKMWVNELLGEMFVHAYDYFREDEGHMMKNSEWGAMAYLTKSIYGLNTLPALNTDPNQVTGGGDYKANVAQSTTGNVYGIYDTVGVTRYHIAAYFPNATALSQYSSGFGKGLILSPTATSPNQSTKYVTIHQLGSPETDVNNYNANSFLTTPKVFGDAVYETSTLANANSAWYNNPTNMSTGANPYYKRGGESATIVNNGLFAFTASSGGLNTTTGFRAVLSPSPPPPVCGSFISDGSWQNGVNTPILVGDMVPIAYDSSNNEYTPCDNAQWYDYANKKWANAKTADGSYWVWVPRYAYRITSGLNTGTAGNIDIVFVDINNKNGATTYSTAYPTVASNAMNNHVVHPSFINGTANGYANGEWDSELPGYWMSKFDTSQSNATNASPGSSGVASSRPNVTSWVSYEVGNMATKGRSYDLSKESHMAKNSEWGATIYLARSNYGKVTEPSSNGTTLTGGGDYKTNVGQSTTGNITGVYDMLGTIRMQTASYVATTTAISHASTGFGAGLVLGSATSPSSSTKYTTIYAVGSPDNAQNNYIANSYLSTPKKFGDAMYETSSAGTGSTSWFGNESGVPNTTSPYFTRGSLSTNTATGLFGFSESTGGQNTTKTFRLVLSPSMSNTILPEQVILTPGIDSSNEVRAAWYSNAGSTASVMRVSTNCPSMASPTTFNGSPSVSVPTAPGKVAHSVEATGLTANTAYCYQVGDGQAQNWSPVYNFRTGPPSGTSFSFIHVTDAHPGRTDNPTAYGNYVATDPVWTNTLAQALVKSPNASLIVSTGDQVDDLGDGSRSDQEDNYYYFTKPPQLRNLILAPTMGNHDNNTAPFSKHFNLPNNPPGITTGASPSSVYSFTRGNALFLVINTEIPANNMATLKTWLTNTATASSAKWKIVLLHKSLYPVCNHYGTTSNPSVPAENYRGELVPVFDSLSIDLVLMGHDHCLVRTWVMKNDAKVNETFNGIYSVNPGGTVYLELPGAALKQYPINPSASGTTFTAVKVGGDVTTAAYNIIDVTSTRLTINTYKASDNSVLDTYGIEKP